MTLDEYIEDDFPNRLDTEGFTIGRGKKIYWYITPMESSCLYRCLPVYDDGTLGRPRYISGKKDVTVVYKKIIKIYEGPIT